MLQQKKEGKKVRQIWKSFSLSCTKKSLNYLIESTWEIKNAKVTIEREKISRMETLEKVRLSSGVDGCDMEWFICLRDILQKNNINLYVYANAIKDLLIHGRGKSGPANCGKTSC